MKKLITLAVLLAIYSSVFAQQQVEMADKLRANGDIYVVVGTIAIVFIGLAIYLFMMDNRLRKIEKSS